LKQPLALSIAGFDPSGGAGVLADARTFAAFGFSSVAAITSLTFQNEREFFGAVHQTAETVRVQVESLLQAGSIACAKTGMLPTREVVSEAASLFREANLPAPVVDPVLMSSSGKSLMDEDAIEVMVVELFPVCLLVTPNIPEAERLTGMRITSEEQMGEAAAQIRKMGARAVLVKGGHLGRAAGGIRQEAGDTKHLTQSIDVLDDNGKVTFFSEQRVEGVELHGSGCILSAAIAAGVGQGLTLAEAAAQAKSFVSAEFRKLTGSAAL
jgi:hydroxymethylpyrimidine kinase/phosphomethylpyrimidine kinase